MKPVILRHLLSCTLCLAVFVATECQAAEEGIAAYYSDVFQGKKTASGELYDKNKLTGSHKKLAFGSKVKVTNLTNNKSVMVTINDRGPYSKKRIIDLSRAAAEEIALIKVGITQVRIEVLD